MTNPKKLTRPYRCKDGRQRSKLMAVRLPDSDRAYIWHLGGGSYTRGVEKLLEAHKSNKGE